MNDDMSEQPTLIVRYIQKHRYVFFLLSVVGIALLFVAASLALYVTSGAAQLDLSRPGYENIREQVQQNEVIEGFSANGRLDDEALDEFEALYDEQLRDAESVDAFGNDVLSPESLQIDK